MTPQQSLIQDNPWWKEPARVEDDTHLQRLEDQPFTHDHSINFDLRADAVYTLRGPRQVGKTTLLKKMIKTLLETNNHRVRPRDILYLNIQATSLSSPNELRECLQEYIEDRRTTRKDSRLYIFIDEVTGITEWGTAIQALDSRGLLDNVFILATGSHALDLKRGGERMPGRRGEIEHPDWVLMPLSFRDYVRALSEQTDLDVPDELPTIDIFSPEHAHQQATELEFYSPPIDNLFRRYLKTGGYPYAIAAEIEQDTIPKRIYLQFQQAIREEMRKAGHDESYFRELVAWAVDKYLGEEFSWRTASGDTEIGSKDTARKYLEDAEAVFIWHILYRIKSIGGPTPAPRSPKKLYTADPFCWHALSAWVQGYQDPWGHTLDVLSNKDFLGTFVESVVGDHLKREFGCFSLYHRTSQGSREIDFVLHENRSEYSLVEVKYRNTIKHSHRSTLADNGGGVLATQDQIGYDEDQNVANIPVYTLLAGLPYDLTLYPSEE